MEPPRRRRGRRRENAEDRREYSPENGKTVTGEWEGGDGRMGRR